MTFLQSHVSVCDNLVAKGVLESHSEPLLAKEICGLLANLEATSLGSYKAMVSLLTGRQRGAKSRTWVFALVPILK